MANGFIYVMSNPSFSDGQIKIGKSMNDPSFRKDNLNSTSLPEPFIIEYFALVDDYDAVELQVHSKLADYRPNKNREFFKCSIPEAILVIRELSNVKYEEVFYKSPEEIKELEEEEELEELERLLELETEEKEREKQQIIKESELREKEKEVKRKERKELRIGIIAISAFLGFVFLVVLPFLLVDVYRQYTKKRLIILEEITNSLQEKKN